MKTLTLIFTLGALVAVTSTARAGTVLDLAPAGLTPYTGIDIGDVQIGSLIGATSTFTIDSAGIRFNPFGNVTSQPDTDELDVFIYAVDGFGTTGYSNEGTRGALLATAALCNGPCANQTPLTPANTQEGALNWFDVPITYTFTAGNHYLVQFDVLPGGWGSGLTAKNVVEFYGFDPALANNPPSSKNTPFTVGPLQVVDGAFSTDFANRNFAHVRLDLDPVPEPGTFVLLGCSLTSLFLLAKKSAKRPATTQV